MSPLSATQPLKHSSSRVIYDVEVGRMDLSVLHVAHRDPDVVPRPPIKRIMRQIGSGPPFSQYPDGNSVKFCGGYFPGLIPRNEVATDTTARSIPPKTNKEGHRERSLTAASLIVERYRASVCPQISYFIQTKPELSSTH
ncbi:hypothetical protein CLAIMM_07388 isoform 2 [Cladophialophora immunda]|nr:hypothetical protein CLAIMM_07388 isoform 2 [Cladophialophora immunda]